MYNYNRQHDIKNTQGERQLKKKQLKRAEEYYELNKSNAEACANIIKNLLEEFLVEKNLHSIEGRVKDKESYLEKCNKRNKDDKSHKYNSYEEVTDLIGIRVIANTMSDVKEIRKVIEREFDIDESKSINKADELKVDRVGYLSVHYIAKLTKERINLTEYSFIKDLPFEIQVRTLLQHAWSEIEHDRSYKFFGGGLGDDIKRRFNLIAGALELLDIQFDELANKVQVHSDNVAEQVRNNKYDIPIDIASLEWYMKKRFGERESFIDNKILEELNYMGLYTISDIENIIPKDFEEYSGNSYIGIIVDILIIYNIEKYKQEYTDILVEIQSLELYRKYGIETDKYFEYFDYIEDYVVDSDGVEYECVYELYRLI